MTELTSVGICVAQLSLIAKAGSRNSIFVSSVFLGEHTSHSV